MTGEKRRLHTEPSGMELLVHQLTLDELLNGARQGLREHIGELHRRFGPDLLRRISAEDSTVTAAEILSDVFMRLPHALETYEDHGKFEAWLWVMAKHRLADKRRKRARQPDQFPEDGYDVRGGAKPGRTFERSDLINKLAESLAPRQREVWLLSMSGLSDPEIAEKLDINANNVAQLLFRARTRLRIEAQALGLTPADIADSGLGPELL